MNLPVGFMETLSYWEGGTSAGLGESLSADGVVLGAVETQSGLLGARRALP